MKPAILIGLLVLAACSADEPAQDTDTQMPTADGEDASSEGTSASTTSRDGGVDVDSDPSGPTTGEASDDGPLDPPPTAGTVIYVHFDGGDFTVGTDDARSNVTDFVEMGGPVAPFPLAAEQRAEVVAAMQQLLSRFDVAIVSQRPTDGDYTMVVVTPTNPFGPAAVSIARPDCDDANPNSVAFVFTGVGPDDATSLAARAAGRAAMTFGLEAVDTFDDLLGTYFNPGAGFTSVCQPLVMPYFCDTHAVGCAEGEQNSFQELLVRLGPGG